MTIDNYSELDEKVAPDIKKDAAIEALQDKLEKEIALRKEERFCWIVVFITLLNAFFFARFDNWGSPIALLILELIPLVILARKFGVPDLTNLLDKYFSSTSGK